MISRTSPSLPLPKPRLDLGAVTARVLEQHQVIRRLLDEIERAVDATRSEGDESVDRLHRAIWELYIALDEHLLFEERALGPLLCALVPSGAERLGKMVIEHNEQRDLLLRLVEDSETDARDAEELAAEALTIVIRFRTDMVLEERSLALLAQNASANTAAR